MNVRTIYKFDSCWAHVLEYTRSPSRAGFFLYFLVDTFWAKWAKLRKSCIFLVDPVWCTVNAWIFSFSRRQKCKYTRLFCKLYPHSLNSQDLLHTIIIISRRGSPKTTKTSSQNYEYTGHNLDTIMAQFFPLQKAILATFIVTFYFFRAQYIGGVFRQCYNEIINHYA